VDYKTDLVLAREYETQLNAYRVALRKLGCTVEDASIVSVRTQD
jgi:hypothetical protein